ncbi:MAG: TerD family protein [Blautia sp.]|nr:TerD family protein [Blautia sp.]
MAVNLVKGQKVDLRKQDGSELKNVMVGLGWDEAKKKGLFGLKGADIDCDATALLCKNGRVLDKNDIVYFGNLTHFSGAVRHMGDNLTGAGEGDDEQILVDLKSLPEDYDKIVFVVNIYKAQERRQHFGMIENAFIHILEGDNGKELCRYNLSENYDGMTAMVIAELYRYKGSWKFAAIGQPTRDNSIGELARRYI